MFGTGFEALVHFRAVVVMRKTYRTIARHLQRSQSRSLQRQSHHALASQFDHPPWMPSGDDLAAGHGVRAG